MTIEQSIMQRERLEIGTSLCRYDLDSNKTYSINAYKIIEIRIKREFDTYIVRDIEKKFPEEELTKEDIINKFFFSEKEALQTEIKKLQLLLDKY